MIEDQKKEENNKHKQSNFKKISTQIIPKSNARFDVETSKLKRIFMVIASALLIGSMLGFMMIKMITNFESNYNEDPAVANANSKDDETNETNQNNLVTFRLGKINAFVLQVGVFTEIANANEWETLFKEAGFKPFIWEKDNTYYLLAGVAPTKEDAQMMATKVKEANFDVYVKEWSTPELEKQVTVAEEKWLKSYITTWDSMLQSLVAEAGSDSEKWQELITQYPQQAELEHLVNTLNKHPLTELNDVDIQSKQHILLDLWYHFESTFD